MKSQFPTLFALGALAAGALILLPPSSRGQAGAAGDEAAVARLLVDVSTQQAQIADNQNKIDEKIAIVAEQVRQARLFVARGGGSK
jgi:hypothetical protein